MKNENFDIHDITAEVIQNATEQVRRSNESMVPPFPPIKDEWLMYEKMEEFVHLQKQNNEILQDIEKNTANLQTIFYKGIMPSEKVLDFPVDCNTLTGSVNL